MVSRARGGRHTQFSGASSRIPSCQNLRHFWHPSHLGEITEQVAESRFRHRALRDFDCCEVQDVLLVKDREPVERQERQCRVDAGSLVAVDKRLGFPRPARLMENARFSEGAGTWRRRRGRRVNNPLL
jgi:hypothetical protein